MLLYVCDYMPNLAYNTWYLPNNRVGITSVGIASVNHHCHRRRRRRREVLTLSRSKTPGNLGSP